MISFSTQNLKRNTTNIYSKYEYNNHEMLHNVMVNMDGFTLMGLCHLTLLQWEDIGGIDRCIWSRRAVPKKRIARVIIYYRQVE